MDPNFFGMTEHPFAPTPDPRFYYKSAAHQTALAALSHAIEESGGPLALMAGAGVGKTTFLLRLAERLRGIPGITLAIQSYPGAQEFLRNLVVNLGVKPSGRDWVELHRQVSVLLAHESLAGKHVLVAIDDAHKLDELALEAVQTVSRSAAEGRNSVQFLLVGQNELAPNLARPFLRDLHQRLSTITRIPVLSETETGLYIEHRLRAAGYLGRQLFTSGALEIIAIASGGVPRAINRLCSQALALTEARNLQVVDEATLPQAVGSIALKTSPNRMHTASQPSPGVSRAAAKILQKLDDVRKTQASRRKSLLGAGISPSTPCKTVVPTQSSSKGLRHLKLRPVFSASLLLLAGLVLAGVWLGPSRTPVPESRTEHASLPAALPTTSAALTPAPSEGNSLATNRAPSAYGPESVTPAPPTTAKKLHTLKSQRREPAPAAQPVDDLGIHGLATMVVVQSNPSGAHIGINGRSSPAWVTPHLFMLVPGVYKVDVIQSGHAIWTRHVKVDKGKERWLSAEFGDEAEAENR